MGKCELFDFANPDQVQMQTTIQMDPWHRGSLKKGSCSDPFPLYAFRITITASNMHMDSIFSSLLTNCKRFGNRSYQKRTQYLHSPRSANAKYLNIFNKSPFTQLNNRLPIQDLKPIVYCPPTPITSLCGSPQGTFIHSPQTEPRTNLLRWGLSGR